MLHEIRQRCILKKKNPVLGICITMYNEDEEELKLTLKGILQNYNAMRLDKNLNFCKEDLVVFCICDGYEKIPASFKKLATDKGFYDENILIEKGFLKKNRDGSYKMKDVRDLMDEGVEAPKNILHLFTASTWDFGHDDPSLKMRRINFIFAIKQRNDGKINSHKWFFHGLCKYLKPQYCLMLDIGTRPDKYSVMRLVNYMQRNPTCGGCQGEIEVELRQHGKFDFAYLIMSSQYFEYKISHFPGKAFESMFEYNAVLPGAYSCFRWEAIRGTPLELFFKNVTRTTEPTCQEANEYLAEDRVMNLQIFIKKNTGFYLTMI